MRECPRVFRKVTQKLLEERRFPAQWKKARLVLISKPGKPAGTPSAYRPLCLLSTAGKALEPIIALRLTAEIEDKALLSDR